MNLDVFLLHNAGLPGQNRNRISNLRASVHVYAHKMMKPNDNLPGQGNSRRSSSDHPGVE